mmetsp:Transcript_3032/g.9184  ORF Transcript_3032/g.9184 Transcript_3032/m.9184 type:complete len:237 (-) Transcript_3032:1405-2115(-)
MFGPPHAELLKGALLPGSSAQVSRTEAGLHLVGEALLLALVKGLGEVVPHAVQHVAHFRCLFLLGVIHNLSLQNLFPPAITLAVRELAARQQGLEQPREAALSQHLARVRELQIVLAQVFDVVVVVHAVGLQRRGSGTPGICAIPRALAQEAAEAQTGCQLLILLPHRQGLGDGKQFFVDPLLLPALVLVVAHNLPHPAHRQVDLVVVHFEGVLEVVLREGADALAVLWAGAPGQV